MWEEKKRVRVNCNTQHMANHMELAALGGAWDLAWNTQGAKLWHISISHLLNYKHSDVHSQETTVSKHQLTDAHPFYTHLVKNILCKHQSLSWMLNHSDYTGKGFIVDQPVQCSSLLFMESVCGDNSCESALFLSVPSLSCEPEEAPVLVIPKFSWVWSSHFDFNLE